MKNHLTSGDLNENLWNFFDEQIEDHDNWAKCYFVIAIAIIIILVIFHVVCWLCFSENFKDFCKNSPLEHINYYLFVLPVIMLDLFLFSKFSKHTKLIDHYVQKKQTLITMENIQKISELPEKDNLLKLYDMLLEPPIINDSQAIKVKLDNIMLEIKNFSKDK